MDIRSCYVAGMFYPGEPTHLKRVLDGFFRATGCSIDAMGIVSPHAGYPYSGQTAAHAFSAIDSGFSGTFVVIGPSHSGFPTCVSGIPWDTPLGSLPPDIQLVNALDLPVDENAMSYGHENSLEVQMPFIRHRFPHASIVPVMLSPQSIREVYRVSEKLTEAIADNGNPVKIVASSDFSHYVSHEKAEADDLYAIEAIKNLDVPDFYERIKTRGVSACGYGPISVMIETLKKRGAEEGRLLSYTTSGEATGDYSQVVGYAALAVI